MSLQALTWRDKFQFVTAIAFLFIGLSVIIRSFPDYFLYTWLVGGGFTAIGGYRLYYFVLFFRNSRRARGNK